VYCGWCFINARPCAGVFTRKTTVSVAANELQKTSTSVFSALSALWITGITLVLMGYLDKPDSYLLNQKLWGKISVVLLLTLNGVLLHFYAFPKVTSPVGVIGLSKTQQTLIIFSGGLSSVSWLFACYLGIARPWNNTVSYGFVMSLYAGLVAATFVFTYQAWQILRKTSFKDNQLKDNPIKDNQLQLNPSTDFK
jgi:hypothetical protein